MGRRSRAEALGTRKDDLDSEASRLGDHDLLPLVRSSRGGCDGMAWPLTTWVEDGNFHSISSTSMFFKKRGGDRELVSAVSRDQTR